MMPSPDDMRRLNPSSAARWDACRGRGSPNYIVGQSDIDRAEAAVRVRVLQLRRDNRDHGIELISIVGLIAGVALLIFAKETSCVMGGLALAVVSAGSFAITCFISGNRHQRGPT